METAYLPPDPLHNTSFLLAILVRRPSTIESLSFLFSFPFFFLMNDSLSCCHHLWELYGLSENFSFYVVVRLPSRPGKGHEKKFCFLYIRATIWPTKSLRHVKFQGLSSEFVKPEELILSLLNRMLQTFSEPSDGQFHSLRTAEPSPDETE